MYILGNPEVKKKLESDLDKEFGTLGTGKVQQTGSYPLQNVPLSLDIHAV